MFFVCGLGCYNRYNVYGRISFTMRKGFTLIELLVVIALIGILGTLGLGSYEDSRAKGRDASRVADMGSLTLALERYYEACREYPATLAVSASNGCPSGTTLGSFTPSIPTDPAGTAYGYATSGAGNGYDAYVLRATLERGHAVLADDIDGSTHDGVSLACDDTSAFYYCLGS